MKFIAFIFLWGAQSASLLAMESDEEISHPASTEYFRRVHQCLQNIGIESFDALEGPVRVPIGNYGADFIDHYRITNNFIDVTAIKIRILLSLMNYSSTSADREKYRDLYRTEHERLRAQVRGPVDRK